MKKYCNFAPVIFQEIILCVESSYLLFSFFLPGMLFRAGDPLRDAERNDLKTVVEADASVSLYQAMGLRGMVSQEAFRQAVAGYKKIKDRKRDVLTLIDFSKPSTEKRLFVFDMKKQKLPVCIGCFSRKEQSGENYATSFSNEYGSYKSSLGFYLTGTTYQGRNGYSLILDGLEKGVNDKARERAIVMHGAAYADPAVASRGGRLGRSFGCPAVPQKLSRPIIDAIKGGSVMFIYAGTPDYLAQSSILNDNGLM